MPKWTKLFPPTHDFRLISRAVFLSLPHFSASLHRIDYYLASSVIYCLPTLSCAQRSSQIVSGWKWQPVIGYFTDHLCRLKRGTLNCYFFELSWFISSFHSSSMIQVTDSSFLHYIIIIYVTISK